MHLLFVCTGNICRSPIAERLTRAYFEIDQPAFQDALTVGSAGVAAVVGHPIERSAGLVLSGLGGSPADFAARQLQAADIVVADLVLTMTRQHRGSVLALAPRMMSRTFTLREAAALLATVDLDGLSEEPDFTRRGRQLVAALAIKRAARVVGHHGPGDDIRDPIGRDLTTFQRVGDAVAEALLPLLIALTARGAQLQRSPA